MGPYGPAHTSISETVPPSDGDGGASVMEFRGSMGAGGGGIMRMHRLETRLL
jgi:hypothetical protein